MTCLQSWPQAPDILQAADQLIVACSGIRARAAAERIHARLTARATTPTSTPEPDRGCGHAGCGVEDEREGR